MRRIDEQYLRTPFYGSGGRWPGACWAVGRSQAGQRLMRLMGLEAIYPKPRPVAERPEHRIYPYLLRNWVRPNQVWSDITYVPMPHGWMYLTVVMDWYSRYVLSWRLSNTLDGQFCLEALEEALCGSARRRSSTPTRACSTRRRRSPAAGGGGRGGEHGRPWPWDGQRVRGAIVADGEIRRHLHK